MIHRPTNWRRDEDEASKRLKDNNSILFSNDDLAGVRLPHDDPLVISVVVANYDVQRILVDNESSTDVLMYDTFSKMCLPRHQLQRSPIPLSGFGGNQVFAEGKIVLLVTLGTEPRQKTLPINFTVVRIPSAYNIILG